MALIERQLSKRLQPTPSYEDLTARNSNNQLTQMSG